MPFLLTLMHFVALFVFFVAWFLLPYLLSLHDALPIWANRSPRHDRQRRTRPRGARGDPQAQGRLADRRGRRRLSRSEEHTSELQSHSDLVCRLLLEKKKSVRFLVSWLLPSGGRQSVHT